MYQAMTLACKVMLRYERLKSQMNSGVIIAVTRSHTHWRGGKGGKGKKGRKEVSAGGAKVGPEGRGRAPPASAQA